MHPLDTPSRQEIQIKPPDVLHRGAWTAGHETSTYNRNLLAIGPTHTMLGSGFARVASYWVECIGAFSGSHVFFFVSE